MARTDEYYEMKELAKQKAREADQQARDASTAPKPKPGAKPAASAGMGDVRLAEAARQGELVSQEDATTGGLREMAREYYSAEPVYTGLDAEGRAALDKRRERSGYTGNPISEFQEEMARMKADPRRHDMARTRAVEKSRGFPTPGAFGPMGDDDYVRRLKADPESEAQLERYGRQLAGRDYDKEGPFPAQSYDRVKQSLRAAEANKK